MSDQPGSSYGGFIGLEPWSDVVDEPHPDGLFLANGRTCFGVILDVMTPARVQVPFYTCDSLVQPLIERGITAEWYGLDEQLLPMGIHPPGPDELIVLVDHFGVRRKHIRSLAIEIGPRAVLDETHAFYSGTPPAGLWSFNSARKFFGVPDGAYAFGPGPFPVPSVTNDANSSDHLLLSALGDRSSALSAFRRNEVRMTSTRSNGSVLSKLLLSRYDHRGMRDRRAANAFRAHSILGPLNLLDIDLDKASAPLCYPLLLGAPVDLAPLHSAGLFIPRYWTDVRERAGGEDFPLDVQRVDRLIAFPIDQRYSVDEVERWAKRLIELIRRERTGG